jgi:hypothetical protein
VDAALAELEKLPEGDLSSRLAKGLKKLTRRALKRCGRLDHRDEEDFHEARKAVKALLGASGILPEGVAALDPLFHDLAELLGDENDLVTLSVWLEGHGFTKRFAPDLWETLAATRRKLQKRVMREAENLPKAE